MSNQANKHPVECVGTLLVHHDDLVELSAAPHHQAEVAMGTLLVPTSDLKELSSSTGSHGLSGGGAKAVLHKVTDTLKGPAPDMEEAERWSA
jgi:hypothetical protein